MNKELDNFVLGKRIDDFKKRYNELLLEMNNSSFLNISKFQSGEISNSDENNNINALLAENSKVSENIAILKESIKEKIKNLELLVKKSKIYEKDYEEYVKTYEEIIKLEKESFNQPQTVNVISDIETDGKVYVNLDQTISKLDEFKDYIENKVLNEIQKSENEKIELTNIAKSLNDKVKEMVKEHDLSKNLINELTISNENLQLECDKTIESWVKISSQVENLAHLIDINEEKNFEIMQEKDFFIEQLESKINDLLFKNAQQHEQIDMSHVEHYLTSVADIFAQAIIKINTDLLNNLSNLEEKYETDFKSFKNKISQLIDTINSNGNRRSLNPINNIEEININSLTYETDQYAKYFASIHNVSDISELFNEYYIFKINFIIKKFEEIHKLYSNLLEKFGPFFDEKSIKKLSKIKNDLEIYLQKINLFVLQINDFLVLVDPFQNKRISAADIDEYFWASFASYIDEIIRSIIKDFQIIFDIRTILVNYLYPKLDEQIVIDDESVNFDIDIEHNNIFYDDYNQSDEYHNQLEDGSTIDEIYEYTNDQIELVQNIVEETECEQEMVHEINNTHQNDDYDANVYETHMVDNGFIDNELSLSTNTIDLSAFHKDFLSEQLKLVEKKSDDGVGSEIIEDVASYAEMCGVENGSSQYIEIIRLIKDHTQPLEQKIDNIEKLLYELLQNSNNKSSNDTDINLLIKKKYNKNLKLRLIKSKLYNLKLRLEFEQDNRYLEIIKGLEG